MFNREISLSVLSLAPLSFRIALKHCSLNQGSLSTNLPTLRVLSTNLDIVGMLYYSTLSDLLAYNEMVYIFI